MRREPVTSSVAGECVSHSATVNRHIPYIYFLALQYYVYVSLWRVKEYIYWGNTASENWFRRKVGKKTTKRNKANLAMFHEFVKWFGKLGYHGPVSRRNTQNRRKVPASSVQLCTVMGRISPMTSQVPTRRQLWQLVTDFSEHSWNSASARSDRLWLTTAAVYTTTILCYTDRQNHLRMTSYTAYATLSTRQAFRNTIVAI